MKLGSGTIQRDLPAGLRSSQPLVPELFPAASALLAEAFYSNPPHIYICPEPASRRARLEWLLGGNLRVQPDLGTSFCLADGAALDAMGFWTRYPSPGPGPIRKLRAGLLRAPALLGWGGIRRLLEVTREIDRHLELSLGDQPFWYLNNMVVRESLRGRGVGTRLLEGELRKIDRIEPGLPIALATQRPENVAFYRRLGFAPVLTQIVGTGPAAFRSWIMVRAHGDGELE